MLKRLIFVGLALSSGTALAESPYDVRPFIESCNDVIRSQSGDDLSITRQMAAIHCIGYVSGALGQIDMRVFVTSGKSCFKGDMKPDEPIRAFLTYTKANPNQLNEPLSLIFLKAINSHYHCNTSQ